MVSGGNETPPLCVSVLQEVERDVKVDVEPKIRVLIVAPNIAETLVFLWSAVCFFIFSPQ